MSESALCHGLERTICFHSCILMFCVTLPPGTCINNTSIMMFKKGSFEVGGTIYPVAVKVNRSMFTLMLLYYRTWLLPEIALPI